MSVALLIFQIFLIAHILSCFWFFNATDLVTGDKSSNNPDQLNLNPTWTVVYGCDQYDTGSQYIISLFWTFQTLLSVVRGRPPGEYPGTGVRILGDARRVPHVTAASSRK
jgi:hypothetical protein